MSYSSTDGQSKRYIKIEGFKSYRNESGMNVTGILYRRFSQSKWKWRGSGAYNRIMGMEKPLEMHKDDIKHFKFLLQQPSLVPLFEQFEEARQKLQTEMAKVSV